MAEPEKAGDLAALIAPYNPRKISKHQLDALGRAMKEFGDLSGIVVNLRTKTLIGGHQRLKHFDPEWKIVKGPSPDARGTVNAGHIETPFGPWVYREVDWPVEKEKLANIAANQHGGEFDQDLLGKLLADLQASGAELALTGFADNQIERMLLQQRLADADAPAPEPPDDPVTKKGDLITLGRHRLLCGDSSKESDLRILLDSRVMDLVNTDPPYNVKVEPSGASAKHDPGASKRSWRATQTKGAANPGKQRPKDRALANDFMTEDAFEEILLAWFMNLGRALKPGGSCYIWGGFSNTENYRVAMRMAGLYFSQSIIWNKGYGVITRKDFMTQHEWCFYGWKEGAGHQFYGPNNLTDVWDVKKVHNASMVHLTEKPVELARIALLCSSQKGEAVLDLFGGSGSTLMACEDMERDAFLMELDEAYCDVIVERWEKFTGRKATRTNVLEAAGDKA
jgi:DNA modification methylase